MTDAPATYGQFRFDVYLVTGPGREMNLVRGPVIANFGDRLLADEYCRWYAQKHLVLLCINDLRTDDLIWFDGKAPVKGGKKPVLEMARQLLMAMETPGTAMGLARRTGIIEHHTLTVVERILARLKEKGLVTKEKNGHWRKL